MAAKQKQPITELTADGREAIIASEPETSFDERTQGAQPWADAASADDVLPEPQIVKPKATKKAKE